MNVVWLTTPAGSGVREQARIANQHLDIQLVSSIPTNTNHNTPHITDDHNVIHPTRSLTETLLDLAPDLTVFHAFNTSARTALRQIHPYTITVARLGVNLHAELLADKFGHVADILDCLNLIDHVITAGEHPKSILEAAGWPDHRMTTIPSMIDASQMARPRRDIPPTVGVLGRVDNMKHQFLALEAANGVKVFDREVVPDLVLAGNQNDGTLQAIEKSKDALGYPGEVKYLGHVSDPFESFWPNVGVHLVPSHTENCPQTVLEAAVSGVPTIGSSSLWAEDMGGLPQAYVEDPATWSRFVYQLLTSPGERVKLVQAQQDMVQKFDVRNVVSEYRELFGGLVDRKINFKTPPNVVA